jgi:hypothetical protein
MGHLSLLVLLPLAVGLLAFVLVRRAATRRDQSHGPTCGKCDYSVRGLTTFICPECGSDLREVGICAFGMRGGPGAPWSMSRKIIMWSIIIAAVGTIISLLVHKYCLPTVYSAHQDYRLVGPASGQYRQVDFYSYGYHLNWPYRQPQRSLILEMVDITLTENDGSTIEMQVTIDELGYEYNDADGKHVLEANGLDGVVVRHWMRSAGIDVDVPGVAAEADEIVQVARGATHLAMNSPRKSVFAGRAGGRSATYTAAPPRIAKPITVFFWIAVWLFGVWRIFRRHQELPPGTAPA